jgi:hypothetical protein
VTTTSVDLLAEHLGYEVVEVRDSVRRQSLVAQMISVGVDPLGWTPYDLRCESNAEPVGYRRSTAFPHLGASLSAPAISSPLRATDSGTGSCADPTKHSRVAHHVVIRRKNSSHLDGQKTMHRLALPEAPASNPGSPTKFSTQTLAGMRC